MSSERKASYAFNVLTTYFRVTIISFWVGKAITTTYFGVDKATYFSIHFFHFWTATAYYWTETAYFWVTISGVAKAVYFGVDTTTYFWTATAYFWVTISYLGVAKAIYFWVDTTTYYWTATAYFWVTIIYLGVSKAVTT